MMPWLALADDRPDPRKLADYAQRLIGDGDGEYVGWVTDLLWHRLRWLAEREIIWQNDAHEPKTATGDPAAA